MNMNNDRFNKDLMDDEAIRHLFKNNLPQAPVTPWFTKKVLNRLPERKKIIAGNIEFVTCLIGLVVTIVFGVLFVVDTVNSDVITIGDILTYIIYLGLAVALTFNVSMPLITRGIYIKK